MLFAALWHRNFHYDRMQRAAREAVLMQLAFAKLWVGSATLRHLVRFNRKVREAAAKRRK